MRYEAAQQKLESEVQNAFLDGEREIEIVHGIGEGILRKMAIDYIERCDFLKLVPVSDLVNPNPGTTRAEILSPSAEILKKYVKRSD